VNKRIDLNKFNRIEDFSDKDLDTLYEIIKYYTNKISDKINEIYIVGSYCFNRPNHKPNDIDIVAIIPNDIATVLYPSIDGVGYRIINKAAEYAYLMSHNHFYKNTELITANIEYLDIDFPPVFDLVNKKWIGKQPYDIFNYTMNGFLNNHGINWIPSDKSKKQKVKLL